MFARTLLLKSTLRVASFSTKTAGTVKWFDAKKGYGFIVPNNGQPDVFVHQMDIKADGFRSLREGETVEFTTQKGDTGKIVAKDVTGPNGGNVLGAEKTSPVRKPRGRGDGDYSRNY